MTIVVVSQRVDSFPDRNEVRDALDQQLMRFLLIAGYMPVPVPNCLHLESNEASSYFRQWIEMIKPGAVVLSGGNNIGACLERDSTEDLLLCHAKKQHLPTLGICRGMQMMGVWAGAELKKVAGHVRTEHLLNGVINGNVNSYHNQVLVSCPPGFIILACSEDGEIEAIGHESLPWQGWMWHPERDNFFKPNDIKRIKELFGE
jgi:N5-(cytidine 5'-diphosphoramidyl)-L-glutamine hydrolase